MRILHVSWEYPPLVYGGLGRHVHALAEAQAAAGHEVTVVSQYVADEPFDIVRNGVRIVRALPAPPDLPFEEQYLLGWVFGLQHAMVRAAFIAEPRGRFDVVHAHDWVVAHAAVTLADAYDLPLVATMHATEAGRHQGWLPGQLQRTVHSIEFWLADMAAHVITCSQHMRWEVETLFTTPDSRITTIPNGIDLDVWKARPRDIKEQRSRWAGDGPLVVFTGRLQWEKGVQTLLEATKVLKRRVPDLRVVVAGRGTYESDLRQLAKALRLGRTVAFTGYLTHEELTGLVAAADVAVVPSLYEPFGLVAIEAAALGTNVVLSQAGGLAEMVSDGITPFSFKPGDAADLADVIEAAIDARPATTKVRRLLASAYSWPGIAERTVAVYVQAAKSKHPRRRSTAGAWDREEREGNLLHPERI